MSEIIHYGREIGVFGRGYIHVAVKCNSKKFNRAVDDNVFNKNSFEYSVTDDDKEVTCKNCWKVLRSER